MRWRLLESLPDEDVRRLMAATRRRSFARNEVLFHEGDPADSLHLISKGRVAARKTTALGRTVTLAVFGAGDVVGEMALIGVEPIRSATVVALEPAETFSVHRDTFADLRREHPAITDMLVQVLTIAVTELSDRLSEALYVSADARVRRRLLHLVGVYGDDTVPLSQEDLAELAGTTRATVNRVLRDEQQRGTVRLGRGRVTIVDPAALEKRAR